MRFECVCTLAILALATTVGCGPGGGSGDEDTGTVIVVEEDTTGDDDAMDADTGVCDAGDEICNGEDDDCDGVVDEGCSCEYDGTSVGVCKAGLIDDEGDCSPPPAHSDEEEACDGQDNDCDGVTDEGCGCTYDHRAKGVCANAQIGPDNGACSQPQVFEEEEATCDGKDNDCDGIVDEGCDCVHGETRDCYTGPEGTNGYGECAPGEEECTEGTWSGICKHDVTPTAETCDNKDNDCDGDVDELEVDEGFEGDVSGWSAFSSGQYTPLINVPASGTAKSGSYSGQTGHNNYGVCGEAGGLAKDFDVGPNADEISMYLKAETGRDAIIGVALQDSTGIHELWRRRASGYSWDMSWRKKTFDISSYDDKFKLIIGNVHDNSDCGDYYYSRWSVWVDDIEAGVDCQ